MIFPMYVKKSLMTTVNMFIIIFRMIFMLVFGIGLKTNCFVLRNEWDCYRPWADGGPHAPPHYLHSLVVFSFTPGSVDLEKAC